MNKKMFFALCFGAVAFMSACDDDIHEVKCDWTDIDGNNQVSMCKEPAVCCAHSGCAVLATDTLNCGSCGNECKEGETCENGTCKGNGNGNGNDNGGDAKECGDSKVACGDLCIDLESSHLAGCEICLVGYANCNNDWQDGCEKSVSNDNEHCGACDSPCRKNERCEEGACLPDCGNSAIWCDEECLNAGELHLSDCKLCAQKFGNCNDNWSDGCETDLSTAENCGTCGNQCKEDEECKEGVCASICSPGESLCEIDGEKKCQNTQTDIANCGACGVICPEYMDATLVGCEAGTCVYNCGDGKVNCGQGSKPLCVNVNGDDISNCGACGYNCADLQGVASATCSQGVCSILTCAEGFADCDNDISNGCETNLKTSLENCGACGNKCLNAPVCNNGTCDVSCDDGLTICHEGQTDVFCSDLSSDVHNCGACDNVCPTYEHALPVCDQNLCSYYCERGYTNCGTDDQPVCVDLTQGNNPEHCGGCNISCKDMYANAGAVSCENNVCHLIDCAENFADCNQNESDGCEINISTDVNNCGGCGETCTDPNSVCYNKNCCVPNCYGKTCGDDGCGGTCGTCTDPYICKENNCIIEDVVVAGCSDGSREGFIGVDNFEYLAACGGAWTVPGMHHDGPACGRKAGNTGENPNGEGCNVEDLCAEGWHVCLGRNDVDVRSESGCDKILEGAKSPVFFATRTSSQGGFNCTPDTIGSTTTNTDDIFGCGDLGCGANQSSCKPLQLGSHDLCRNLKINNCSYTETDGVIKGSGSLGCNWCRPLDYYNYVNGTSLTTVWDCGSNGSKEALNVTKKNPYEQGGVLCCKDQCKSDADCPNGKTCVYSVCK